MVAVPGTQAPSQLKCVLAVQSEQAHASKGHPEADDVAGDRVIGYAELNPKLFSSIVSQPRVEIFQQVQVQAVSPSTPSEAANSQRPTKTLATAPDMRSKPMNPTVPTSLGVRMLFVNVIQGQFLVAFRSVASTTPVLQAIDRFRVELRLLHNRSAWEKSTTARRNKERDRVEWSDRQADGRNSE